MLDSTSTHSRLPSVGAGPIKTSHSPSKRSIPQAQTRDAHQWQHNTPKPAIPHLDARFHKYMLNVLVEASKAIPRNNGMSSGQDAPALYTRRARRAGTTLPRICRAASVGVGRALLGVGAPTISFYIGPERYPLTIPLTTPDRYRKCPPEGHGPPYFHPHLAWSSSVEGLHLSGGLPSRKLLN